MSGVFEEEPEWEERRSDGSGGCGADHIRPRKGLAFTLSEMGASEGLSRAVTWSAFLFKGSFL